MTIWEYESRVYFNKNQNINSNSLWKERGDILPLRPNLP